MYIIGFGEIFTKGENRNFFEAVLKSNIKKALNLEDNQLINLHNRYLALTEDATNLKYVFGIAVYAKAIESSFEDMNKIALSLIKKEKTFKVNVKRLTKEIKPSQELNREIGAFILEHKPKLKVKMDDPDITVNIEIINGKAFLYSHLEKGLQGLPLSTAGQIYLNITNEKNATVAGFLLMKRGCNIVIPKPLKLLDKFSFNKNIIISKEKGKYIASDLQLKKIPKKKTSTIFYPLAGYSQKEINNLYKRIKLL